MLKLSFSLDLNRACDRQVSFSERSELFYASLKPILKCLFWVFFRVILSLRYFSPYYKI